MLLKQIIGTVDAGQVLPQVYAEALAKDLTSFAIVLAQDGKLVYDHVDKDVNAAGLMDVCESLKDHAFNFIATKGGKLSVESMQPFFIKNASETAVLSAVIGGTLMVPMPPKSEHAQSYHAWLMVEKKLIRLYNQASDLKAFRASLIGEEFKDDMGLILGTEGAMSLLHFDGSMDHCGMASKGGTFSWGMVSDALGYQEKQEKAAQAPEKPKGLLAALKGKTTATEEKPPSEAPVTPAPQANPPPAKTPDTAVPEGSLTFTMFKPPAGMTKDKQLHRLLNEKFGCLPVGAWDTYKQGGSFPAPDLPIKFENSKKYEAFRQAASASTTKTVPQSVLTQVSPPSAPTEKSPEDKEQDLNYVVPAEGKKHFNEVFRKYPSVITAMSDSKVEVMNPKVVGKTAKPVSHTFAEQGGVKNGVLGCLGWDDKDIQAFIRDEDPTLVFLFVRDLMLEVIASKAANAKKVDAAPPKAEEGAKPQGLLASLKGKAA